MGYTDEIILLNVIPRSLSIPPENIRKPGGKERDLWHEMGEGES